MNSTKAAHLADERARWLALNIVPHEAALRAWLRRRPVAGLEVDDVVQETYARLSLVASISEVRDPRNYMFRTAHSVLLTFMRRSRVVPMISFGLFEGFVDNQPDPEASALVRDELSRLARAIAVLPPKMREVFVLRRVEGLSQRQVAERLGISESTVEKHMGSGFRRIADILAGGGTALSRASIEDSRNRKGSHAPRDKRAD